MGLFSSSSPPPALNEDIEEALSPAYRADVVGKREYSSGLNKLAKEQQELSAALKPGERLQIIVPCLGAGTYDGLAVLTQSRVLDFKRSIRKQMTLDHIAEVEARVHPRGYAIVSIKGRNYIPYSEHMRKAAFDEYMRNYIQFSMSGVEVAKHFIALVNGIRANPNAANLGPSGRTTPEAAARDITSFYPTLYASALRAAGKSATEHNIEAVARLAAVNLALNAHTWFDALGDADARSRFDAQFNADNRTPAWHVPDDMVDFLWAWTSRCHPGLRDFADQMVKTIVSSASRFGDPLPADLWSQE